MAIKKNNDTLLPVYLINGEDELKRDTVLKRLKTRIATLGDLSFNSDVFQGESAVGANIVAACNTMPFASQARLVLVNHADKLKKADSEALVTYLSSPSDTTVLALVAEKLAKNTRLYKAVAGQGKTAIIDCAPLKRYELPKTIRSLAVGHGVTITEGAANKLLDLVGENTIRLDSELKKIALAHRGTNAVSEREIEELISSTAEIKPWDFVDAFADRNQKKCMLCLMRMPSTSPHALLSMCVMRLRELVCVKSLAARGQAGSAASALKIPDWRVKNHQRWAKGYSSSELRAAFVAARDTERALKSGTDPDVAFLEWVLAVTRKA